MRMNKEGKKKTSFCLIHGDQKFSIIVWTDSDSDLLVFVKYLRFAILHIPPPRPHPSYPW